MIFKGFKGSSLPACGPKSSAEGSAGMGSWVPLNAEFGLQISPAYRRQGVLFRIPHSAFRNEKAT
jgi:hypothetical protein